MSADQNRNKKPSGKNTREKRERDKRQKDKRGDNEQSLHRPYRGYDEDNTNGTAHSEQIGEFSNWSKRS